MRNNGGGHYNHSLFWESMSPDGGGEPGGDLAEAIDAAFGSFDEFKAEFKEAGVNQFGWGWAWLVTDGSGLAIAATPNQDNPISTGTTPLLGVDVWEHAYYLKYQNKRPDYIDAWWNMVNWDKVGGGVRLCVVAVPPSSFIRGVEGVGPEAFPWDAGAHGARGCISASVTARSRGDAETPALRAELRRRATGNGNNAEIPAAIGRSCGSQRDSRAGDGRQFEAAGVDRRAVARRVARGWLVRRHRGMFQVRPVAARYEREMAALLAMGADAVLSHSRWPRFELGTAYDDDVHVTVQRRGRQSRPASRSTRPSPSMLPVTTACPAPLPPGP